MPMFLFLRRLRHSPAAFCGLIIILLLMLIALFAPWLAPHDPNWQDAAARLQAPSRQHWLGTDSYGRDLLSRLIYGSRPALGLVALDNHYTPGRSADWHFSRVLRRLAGTRADAFY